MTPEFELKDAVSLVAAVVATLAALAAWRARDRGEARNDASRFAQAEEASAVNQAKLEAIQATLDRISRAEEAHTSRLMAGQEEQRERLARLEAKMEVAMQHLLPPVNRKEGD